MYPEGRAALSYDRTESGTTSGRDAIVREGSFSKARSLQLVQHRLDRSTLSSTKKGAEEDTFQRYSRQASTLKKFLIGGTQVSPNKVEPFSCNPEKVTTIAVRVERISQTLI
jgi:hypothetical protein